MLGQIVKYDDILNSIYAINGVERIRTVFYPEGYPNPSSPALADVKTRACDGIAFASWSSSNLFNDSDIGVDL